ncbi:MAG: choloylglycine hydrolase [Eubacterium sp.]
MCTSIAFNTKDFYFGRNMDIGYNFGEQVVITPRNYPFKFKKEKSITCHYALIGMASVMDNCPLYAEAANEKGLCMAGLNFPGYAYFGEEAVDGKSNITPYEIIPWVLAQCENVPQAKELLKSVNMISIPFKEGLPVAQLHWHIADKNESIVLESTKTGLHVYDNPLNVLTNPPGFEFQLTNTAQYLNLRTDEPSNIFSEEKNIKPFGKGMGSIGLPGDFSPASRFVKAAYLLLNSQCNDDENSSIAHFFHLLDSVAVTDGAIVIEDADKYITTYSCCINANKGEYYYKTYSNNQLTSVKMHSENLDGEALIAYPLVTEQQINQVN